MASRRAGDKVYEGQGADILSEESVDICVIDDDASQRKLVARLLEKRGYTVAQAEDGRKGFEIISHFIPKVVLSDWMMPGMDGLALCEKVRQNPNLCDIYYVLLTSRDTVDDKAVALEVGADDFLSKPCNPRELIARVKVGIRVWTLKDELRRAAITDGLTGLYNHEHFSRLLESEYSRAHRYKTPLSLIISDLDHFKSVNDNFGHEVGNIVLKHAAEALKSTIRDVDVLARYGGEEFAVILPQTDTDSAVQLADRIRQTIPETVPAGMLGDRKVTCSFGVASSDDSRAINAQQLINLADRALYKAKRDGRNRVVSATQLNASTQTKAAPSREVDVLRRQIDKLTRGSTFLIQQFAYTLLQAIDARDHFTAKHSRNVKFYADSMASELGIEETEKKVIGRAALWHDVGVIALPDRLLGGGDAEANKPNSSRKQIPEMGLEILENLPNCAEELLIIRHQKECFGGYGRPDGLRAEDIPLGSRIIRVADALDELTIRPGFQPGCSLAQAHEQIRKKAGQTYDPMVVQALGKCLDADGEEWELRIGSICPPTAFT